LIKLSTTSRVCNPSTFEVVTLFPEFFKPYFAGSILGRAVKKGLIKINFLNLRDFSLDKKHRRVDHKAYGGGPGMVIQIQPIIKAVEFVKSKIKSQRSKIKVILFTPAGKQFNSKMAARLAKNCDNLILICGHYEGIDERVQRILKAEEISVGPYVLSGGELAAMIVIDAVGRKIKGVLGKEGSLEERRLGVGVPVYTRPEVFIYKSKKYSVPQVLLSGNHRAIVSWRISHRKSG